MRDQGGGGARSSRDIGDMVSERAGQYVEIFERAGRRLIADDYHSEDFVDDWFTGLGMIVRDTISATTVGWRAMMDAAPASPSDVERPDERR